MGRDGGAPSRRARAGELAFIGSIGVVGGLALTATGSRRSRIFGIATGAAVLAGAEAIARRRHRPGQVLPLWHRSLATSTLAAPLGWAAGRLTLAGPVGIDTGAGALVGAAGVRPHKVVFGPLFGLALGRVLTAINPRLPAPAVGPAFVSARST